MKSVLIIGMGRFGQHLSQKFMQLGDEVMIVDHDEHIINELADSVTSARIADCTDEHALKALGVSNFDLCFVCMGESLEGPETIDAPAKNTERIVQREFLNPNKKKWGIF